MAGTQCKRKDKVSCVARKAVESLDSVKYIIRECIADGIVNEDGSVAETTFDSVGLANEIAAGPSLSEIALTREILEHLMK